MPRQTKLVDATGFTADDIDRFAQHITSKYKRVQVDSMPVSYDSIDMTIETYLNRDVDFCCGRWNITAVFPLPDGENVRIVVHRYVIAPDANRKVEMVSYAKE